MDSPRVRSALKGLPLGGVRYFNVLGSTNDAAKSWADAGASDLSLVIADEQTAGRGRLQRRWFTPPGAALAFSLILREKRLAGSTMPLSEFVPRYTALGALAVSQAIRMDCHLESSIKWPNDVLLDGRKVAGVLTEAHWQGNQLDALILGIGINVKPEAIPPEKDLLFPATCINTVMGSPINRLQLLRSVVEQVIHWRERLYLPDFLSAWEDQLAFRNEWVYIYSTSLEAVQETYYGQVIGLDPQGGLTLRQADGKTITLHMGEVHLRPVKLPGGVDGSNL